MSSETRFTEFQVTLEPLTAVTGLQQLLQALVAVVVVKWPDSDPDAPVSVSYRWVREGISRAQVDELVAGVPQRLGVVGDAGSFVVSDHEVWQVRVQRIDHRTDDFGDEMVVVIRAGGEPWTAEDLWAVRIFADLWGAGWRQGSGYAVFEQQHGLDQLLVEIAEHVVSTRVDSLEDTLRWTVKTLADFLGADTAFLRRNDHEAGTSVLVAEYPDRPDAPDPDPLGVVPFDSDPLFAATRDFTQPLVGRSSAAPDGYLSRIALASGVEQLSGAAVPLLHDGVTHGCLGFVRFGEREWTAAELSALLAVAALLMQLQRRIDAEEQLRYGATHDDLTGLYNRRALQDELDRRSRAGAGFVLLFLDLDRFKVMNDYLGHAAGDQVLATIAERIQASLRPGDFVARLGGDEFVVLLSDAGGDLHVTSAARRLLDLIEEPIELNGQDVTHTASIGIALSRSAGTRPLDLLRQADTALYAAKARGRNTIEVFNETMQSRVDYRSNIELGLRTAVNERGLRLYYQPEFDLESGRLLAAEALVRWQHPTRGLLTAGEFITLAEEGGAILDIGTWVLEEACRQMAMWRRRHPGHEMTLRVNMSPAQLAMTGVVEHIDLCLRLADVPASALCLEITEHALVADMDQLVTVLRDLRALGVTLAIDDFGTGHSSMVQLKELPIQVLKVDKTFVDGLADDRTDRAIVAAIVGLGEAMGLEVVAEGVEHRDDLLTLSQLGCHRAQGFLLGRPSAAEGLEVLLEAGGIDLAALEPSVGD